MSTTNGTIANGTKQNVKTTVPVISPTEKKPETPKQETAEQKPLEDRILKVQMLSDLIERREKLQDTIKKLSSFKLATDSSRDKLTITDGKGSEFLTTNSACIADVVATLKVSLQNKLVETEAQIIL